jgi:hypothetical protein
VCQKVHLFRSSLGFLVEAQSRLENRRGKKALFGRGAHEIFKATARTTKQMTSLEKLQIYFVSTFFNQIHSLIHINNFFINKIFYLRANKTRSLLFAIQLLIYIIYGDRTIIAIIICDVRRRIIDVSSLLTLLLSII